jgi:hypothetical protein
LPQVGEQSSSLTSVQPGAQQPSPETHWVIAVNTQLAVQLAPLPIKVSEVHAFVSSQLAGQLASQTSLTSTVPLPQSDEQSSSTDMSHPEAQQPSPLMHEVISVKLHAALQLVALPLRVSTVQLFPSWHVVGQLPSQTSPSPMMPSPHTSEQSESLIDVQPGAQQPSPAVQAVMAVLLHDALQLAALPERVSVVQAIASSQLVGQSPPSQVSPTSRMPLPQVGEQSPSVSKLHPSGQQPSSPAQLKISVATQLVVHSDPVSSLSVQATPSSQLVGQLPSHDSPGSTTPLPQRASQSLSSLAVQLSAQQPSSSVQAVISG